MPDPNYIAIPQNNPITLVRPPPDDDLNKYIQNMTVLLEEVDLKLIGKRKAVDKDGNIIIENDPEGRPMVNTVGRNAILTKLRTYLNPNTYMASINEEDTRLNFEVEIQTFSSDLVSNHHKYGLTCDDYHYIMNMVAPIYFMALRKAQTDKKAMYDKGPPQQVVQPQQQGGLFGLQSPFR